ncbi:MAG TPA: ATP-grasp domain-containing protein [Longimicrobiaceae bacterium]|nr:ATP-grasp domain-containing protein [Longimicrobiaceae bacterium]
MNGERPVTLLCLATFEKGADFMREAKRQGARVLLVTIEKLRSAAWPRESIDDVFYLADDHKREDILHGVSYLVRERQIDRIVSLDEFDLEVAAALREHLRIPGMGDTTVRYFRDKLAMRIKAREEGILVPDFVPVLNYDRIREFMERVPPPWILKPRTSASAIGLKKIHSSEELWRTLDELGDEQSFRVLEKFVPGDVFHVDAIVNEREVLFDEAHQYANPPFDVYHGGGLFCSRTLPRESEEARTLKEMNRQLVEKLGLLYGPLHSEFIRGHEDGRYYFLETAARVGGAHITDLVEAATGVNLFREWAKLEIARARGEQYRRPEARQDYAGVLISLARQEWPDTRAYREPEIVWRMTKKHHAGLIVASQDPQRVWELLQQYMHRFYEDFYARMPAAEKPTA